MIITTSNTSNPAIYITFTANASFIEIYELVLVIDTKMTLSLLKVTNTGFKLPTAQCCGCDVILRVSLVHSEIVQLYNKNILLFKFVPVWFLMS